MKNVIADPVNAERLAKLKAELTKQLEATK